MRVDEAPSHPNVKTVIKDIANALMKRCHGFHDWGQPVHIYQHECSVSIVQYKTLLCNL